MSEPADIDTKWPRRGLLLNPTELEERRVVDPVTGGEKGQKLERFDLIPFDALTQVARVYGVGSQKYDPWNWARGYRWSLSLGALLRHVALWAVGVDNDKETGLPHMAHACWHTLTLLAFASRGLGTDDRNGKTSVSAPVSKVKL